MSLCKGPVARQSPALRSVSGEASVPEEQSKGKPVCGEAEEVGWDLRKPFVVDHGQVHVSTVY